MMKLQILLLLTVGFASCSKRQPCNQTLESLQGHWRWTQTSGGISGSVQTPENSGDDIFLDIYENQTYQLTKNNVVTASGKYKISSTHCMHTNSTKQTLQLNNPIALTIESNSDSTLLLGEEIADGFLHEYKK